MARANHAVPEAGVLETDQGAVAHDAVAEVASAMERWRSLPDLRRRATDWAPLWLRDGDLRGYAEECAGRAADLMRSPLPGEDADTAPTARFCLIGKRPQVSTETTMSAIVARAMAFGITIHKLCTLGQDAQVARVLYPAGHRNFDNLPREPQAWKLLADQFDTEQFKEVFGRPYSEDLVVCGREAMERFGLSAQDLTLVWEEGRQPIGRTELLSRYGEHAADLMLGGHGCYEWFRGRWPIGIHRITAGLVAFAMRHERVAGADPVIVLNGHVPGLSVLFGETTIAVEAGTASSGPPMGAVRRWLTGEDNRPAACQPGSIRRDAHDGMLRLDSPVPVDSRMNVVHCSDGPLSGMIESVGLFGPASGGELAARLRARGLTQEEITGLVAADPVVSLGATSSRLTELTRGLGLSECVDLVTRVVPPIFGPANGYGDGVSLRLLDSKLGTAAPAPAADSGSPGILPGDFRELSGQPLLPGSFPGTDDQAGREMIARGQVAMVAAAGGTGGRFGGYHVPETDLQRQKALLPLFKLDRDPLCALDIRVANAVYWRNRTGGRLPVAILGSQTNYDLLAEWQFGKQEAGVSGIELYRQHGIYRIRDRAAGGATRPAPRWIDEIVRNGDGSPSLKPPGNMGMLTCLAMSGIADSWAREGTQVLVMANGDDVGFRLDPRVLGFMSRRPDVDAVVAVVAWGVKGRIRAGGRDREVRADASGWCLVDAAERGALRRDDGTALRVAIGSGEYPVIDPAYDIGGLLCEVRDEAGWRPAVIESVERHGLGAADFLSTNQVYLRMTALRRLMNLGDGTDLPGRVAEFVASRPFGVERKVVVTDAGPVRARQVSQTVSSIFRQLTIVPVLVRRFAIAGEYGGYAPLKSEADSRCAQLFLEESAKMRDHLALS